MAINHPGPAVSTFVCKLQQNWRWSKAQRWAHLIEEHDLNPVIRGKRAMRKAWWRLVHRATRLPAAPIFLVGVQRSGTNLLAHGLDEMPEFQVFNEGNTKAFDEYRLRSLPTVEQLVRQSGAKFALFKPLCDSHRTPELLAHFAPRARAIWAYRNVDGRVRSAVAKFGESNLRVLRAFAAGEEQRPWSAWQVQGLSDESASFIRSLDFNGLTAESAAALFWYVRNLLYFEMALDRRPDTVLVNYDEFLADPERVARALCNFLDQPYGREMIAHVDQRRPAQRPPLAIDQRIRERCSDLKNRLDGVCAAQMSRLAGDRSIRLSGPSLRASAVANPQQG